MRLVLASIAALLVVYAVRPVGMSLYTGTLIAGMMLMIGAVGAAFRGGRLRMDPAWWVTLLGLAAYTLWILWRGYLSDPLDLFLLKAAVVLVLAVPAAVAVDVIGSREGGIDRACLYLFLCFVVQAIIVVAAFVSPSVRAALVAVIPPTGNLSPMHALRMRGFSHAGGSYVAAAQALGLLLGGHLLLTGGTRTVWRLLGLALAMLLILASILLTGRTGFLILPFVLLHVGSGVIARVRSTVRPTTIAAVGLIALAIAATTYTVVVRRGDTIRPAIERVTAEFVEDGSGGLQSRTLSVLFGRMWFAPESTVQFLIGDASSWEERRISSDVGVIRRLHATGMVGVVLTFAAVAALAWPAFRRATTPSERRLMFLLLMWAFALEFKEPFATTSGIAAPLMILSVAASRAYVRT